ncbi:hypothetical protein ACT6P6_11160 [Priestia endophytica]|jgi:hypothetical protein|uniref:Uncharacterized protein n=1 Tax=Priestia endophytica DSM 13796 TaxID=1121089 RepID=A0A1I6BS38_9BACI|nr:MULTISPECIES: hypothetical protein [Priestia]MED3728638.1 hypothetical protein [Priestia filamentosa]MED4073597.1 hypothetical protein [Priestia endophytica]RPK14603.1 hypothetical protein FH5_00038 [Priestia endophytica]SFQ83758.1 hypothetical protein SAMN02745910_04100 [Priestia endophytica DSM 13796]
MMFWIRALMIGSFSLTALSLFAFQGVEIFHAFVNMFGKDTNI